VCYVTHLHTILQLTRYVVTLLAKCYQCGLINSTKVWSVGAFRLCDWMQRISGARRQRWWVTSLHLGCVTRNVFPALSPFLCSGPCEISAVSARLQHQSQSPVIYHNAHSPDSIAYSRRHYALPIVLFFGQGIGIWYGHKLVGNYHRVGGQQGMDDNWQCAGDARWREAANVRCMLTTLRYAASRLKWFEESNSVLRVTDIDLMAFSFQWGCCFLSRCINNTKVLWMQIGFSAAVFAALCASLRLVTLCLSSAGRTWKLHQSRLTQREAQKA